MNVHKDSGMIRNVLVVRINKCSYNLKETTKSRQFMQNKNLAPTLFKFFSLRPVFLHSSSERFYDLETEQKKRRTRRKVNSTIYPI